jgi:hypothetical protein
VADDIHFSCATIASARTFPHPSISVSSSTDAARLCYSNRFDLRRGYCLDFERRGHGPKIIDFLPTCEDDGCRPPRRLSSFLRGCHFASFGGKLMAASSLLTLRVGAFAVLLLVSGFALEGCASGGLVIPNSAFQVTPCPTHSDPYPVAELRFHRAICSISKRLQSRSSVHWNEFERFW